MTKEKNLELENEKLRKQIAELSKFKHERKGTSKKETLDQISTPAHISQFMKELVSQDGTENLGPEMVIDISCGAGSLLLPWKNTSALLIGADLDQEALELCQQNLPQALLFQHDSLACPTPCAIREHIFYEGTNWEKVQEYKGKKIFVMNPPFSLARKMISKVLELAENE
jgi:predicted RNA methylase